MSVRLDKFLVIDLEATCWEDGVAPNGKLQKEESEIIEIGVCEVFKLDNKYHTGRLQSYYVKPTKHIISDYCEELTGISESLLEDKGTTLDRALHNFNKDFAPKYKPYMAWGNYDKKQILKECEEKQILNRYKFSDTYLNIKNLFSLKYGLDKEIRLSKALELAGMEFIGNAHSGKDDAHNTARILLKLINPL